MAFQYVWNKSLEVWDIQNIEIFKSWLPRLLDRNYFQEMVLKALELM